MTGNNDPAQIPARPTTPRPAKASMPVVTMIGLQFTFLIAGAVLVENVFNLPGLGRLAYQALTQRDIVVMQSVVLFFSALVIVMNFVVDIAYLFIDPRLRAGAQ